MTPQERTFLWLISALIIVAGTLLAAGCSDEKAVPTVIPGQTTMTTAPAPAP